MSKKLLSKVTSIIMFVLIMAPVFSVSLPAKADEEDLFGMDYGTEIGLAGDEDSDVRTIIASIITVIMSFLGLIAVIVILLGGFKWMTAGGNDDKVSEAINLIKAGVIGLVIILGAWVIANWVISTMQGDVLGVD